MALFVLRLLSCPTSRAHLLCDSALVPFHLRCLGLEFSHPRFKWSLCHGTSCADSLWVDLFAHHALPFPPLLPLIHHSPGSVRFLQVTMLAIHYLWCSHPQATLCLYCLDYPCSAFHSRIFLAAILVSLSLRLVEG
ncbi:hypothetical protein BD779DRAFT_1545137 [Infundibulicybe gibba]|nr:hypothetical protein BD779DRAFT_1545137 [Infundibulicybe gibba]